MFLRRPSNDQYSLLTTSRGKSHEQTKGHQRDTSAPRHLLYKRLLLQNGRNLPSTTTNIRFIFRLRGLAVIFFQRQRQSYGIFRGIRGNEDRPFGILQQVYQNRRRRGVTQINVFTLSLYTTRHFYGLYTNRTRYDDVRHSLREFTFRYRQLQTIFYHDNFIRLPTRTNRVSTTLRGPRQVALQRGLVTFIRQLRSRMEQANKAGRYRYVTRDNFILGKNVFTRVRMYTTDSGKRHFVTKITTRNHTRHGEVLATLQRGARMDAINVVRRGQGTGVLTRFNRHYGVLRTTRVVQTNSMSTGKPFTLLYRALRDAYRLYD